MARPADQIFFGIEFRDRPADCFRTKASAAVTTSAPNTVTGQYDDVCLHMRFNFRLIPAMRTSYPANAW